MVRSWWQAVKEWAAPSEPVDLPSEGSRERAWREGRARCLSFPFFISEFIVTGAAGAILGVVGGILVFLGMITLVLIGSIPLALKSQRDEARVAGASPQPQIAFERAEIPKASSKIDEGSVFASPTLGRVIRVPVTNQQGAPMAKNLHGTLSFRRLLNPYTTQAQWKGGEAEVDLPGHGGQRFLDVLMVSDRRPPSYYEWTERSREANLIDYELEASAIEVEITVKGEGNLLLRGVLRVEVQGFSLFADWIEGGPPGDEVSNYADWKVL